MNQLLQNLKSNWKSGITVAFVSIPLSVSLAVASHTSPVAGIITAIWAGFVASLFGGSNFNIIGPTGALSGLLATYAIAHGDSSLGMLAIVAGIFTLVAYFFRLERFLVFVPASTVHGFTLGVAFIISLNQLNYALGLQNLPQHEKFISNIFESLKHINQASWPTFGVFVLFLAGLFFIAKILPKLPGAILLAPIGILLGYLSQNNLIPLKLITLGSKYPDLTGKLFTMPQFTFETSLISAGAAIAVVAILETMISAKIADGMTKTHHKPRKEMFGLGLANIASGLMGGIPATAALARTSLNVKSGATDKMSGAISSISVAVISVALLSWFSFIPMAVIAAILVFVAVRMVELHHLIHLWKYDKVGYALAILVSIVCIYEDPIIGILFGTSIALLIFMEKLSRGQFDLLMNDLNTGKVHSISGESIDREIAKHDHLLVYSIKGPLAYINSQSHISRFQSNLKEYHSVILRLREMYFIDMDGVDALDEIITLILQQNKKVVLTGITPQVEEILKRDSKMYKQLRREKNIYEKTTDALTALKES